MAFLNRKILSFAQTLDPSNNPPEFDQSTLSYNYGCQYFLPPPPPPLPLTPKHEMSTVLILMLCLLAATFLFLSYLTITKYRRNSSSQNSPPLDDDIFRQDPDEQQGHVVDHHIWHIRTVGLPQSFIDSIAVFKYKKGESLIEGSDCSVCLNEFEEDECLRLLPKCDHSFHVNCIDTWLRSHQNCPVCRAPIVSTNTNSNIDQANLAERSSNSTISEENQVGNELESEGVFGTNEISAREIMIGVGSSVLGGVENNKGGGILSKNECFLDKRNGGLRVLSDLNDRQGKMDRQQLRRSISLDFGSASTVFVKKGQGRSVTNMEIVEKRNLDVIGKRGIRNTAASVHRLMKCSSYGSSLQKLPVLMKRSFSLNGKRSLRKHSRTLESILALR